MYIIYIIGMYVLYPIALLIARKKAGYVKT